MNVAEYLLACLAMGAGIGADVAVATLSRTRLLAQLERSTWTRDVTLAHVVFPMLGYYAFYAAFTALPVLGNVLGATAFLLLATFLFKLFRGWTSRVHEGPDAMESGVIPVIAVSLDALYSGPAKSAQAIAFDWSHTQIFLSFFLCGAVVFAMAVTSESLGKRLTRSAMANAAGSGPSVLVGLKFLEFTVLLYFALLAVQEYVLRLGADPWRPLAISAAITLILFSARYRDLRANARAEAGHFFDRRETLDR